MDTRCNDNSWLLDICHRHVCVGENPFVYYRYGCSGRPTLSGVLSAKEAFAGLWIQTSYYLWACLLLVKLFLQQVSQ